MDKQKDAYIREKLQKDQLISKKADDTIQKLIKEDLNMKEELKNEVNTEESKKSMKKWEKRLLATAASLVILFCAANVYASTQGYENIFFMIRYLVAGTQENVEEKEINISNEPISITENIKIQITNLKIKGKETKLIVAVKEKETEKDSEIVPLRYKVYNASEEMLCNQTSVKLKEKQSSSYEEELKLENYQEEETKLKLEIYKANDELIATLTIDLEQKMIEVTREQEMPVEEIKEEKGNYTVVDKTPTTNNSTETNSNQKITSNETSAKQTLTGMGYTITLYSNNTAEISLVGEDLEIIFAELPNNIDNKTCKVTGISGEVEKMYQGNEGTGVSPITFFIMKDGTVEYIQPLNQIINNNNKIPASFKIDGKVQNVNNVVDIKTNEDGVIIAITKDGREIKCWNQWMENMGEE